MKCPKCQFENSAGVNFCVECGGKLEKICPECGYSNSPSHKFCGGCGFNLTVPSESTPKDLSFDEKIDKIQRYLPKGLTEKILSQRNKIEGERKQVTVMFSDMEGFTGLVEHLGSEEAYDIMDQVYEILIHKVHNYEGTVNEMTGDGIMALFGAPIALEDAPQRAIRSAIAIHREMSKFSDKLKQEKPGITQLKMRIGIHTGPVVVGTLGNDLRVEFKAVGDTVNLASRMEGLAEPGTSYVTDETFKLTEGFFRFEGLGEKEVKGKTQPLKIYRVIAPSSRRTRFEVTAERGLTPLVARKPEIDIMLDGFEMSKKGRGRAFSIAAEAGVGKSRLLYEFRKAVTNENITFLEGKCLSYGRGMAYHPIIDILKGNFHIQDGESDEKIREKVKKGLEVLGMDEMSILPYFLELLSVKDSGIEKLPISPEAKKERITEVLKAIVLRGAEKRHIVMAIEDLHWIDQSSEEVLKHLLDSIPGARVLLIFTYRLEFVPKWGGKSYHTQLNLNRFSQRDSRAMVTHILQTEEFAQDLEQLILEQTEGIPLFIEEFIKALYEIKMMEIKNGRYHLVKDLDKMAVPPTIKDIIMARVDSLPNEARKVLQTGAVIEREFNYELIRRVTGLLERDLLSHMSVLKDLELIYERGIFPQSTYIFKHALTRDAVYESILNKRKKKLHQQTAFAIEDLYEPNLEQHYGHLAGHYAVAENYDKAAYYSMQAAQKAEKTASIGDAIEYCKKRVTYLEKLPITDLRQKEIIDARTILGLYFVQMLYYEESKEAIDPIVELAHQMNYEEKLPAILTIKGNYAILVQEDYFNGCKHFEDAVKIAGRINDTNSLLIANWRLAFVCCLNCEFEKASRNFKQALDICKAANDLWGIARVRSYESLFLLTSLGNMYKAYLVAKDAIRNAEESGDSYSKAFAYPSLGFSYYGKGWLKGAIKALLKGVALCEKLNLSMWSAVARWFLAEVYFEVGEYQQSRHHYQVAVQLLEQGNAFPSWMAVNKIGVEKAALMTGDKHIDMEVLNRYMAEGTYKYPKVWKTRFIAQILLNSDKHHFRETDNWIRRAIQTAEQNHMMWHLAKSRVLYAKFFKRKGDTSKARKQLSTAIEIFKECGAEGWVEKYEKELAAF
ncbi:MAG: adenylate/guanylate cyclase domain-containing protein [Thermodesulfobacteriota bacterium]|nr:adenylate/guanylate cyclase domain-containing protein [Thermodesulfobacteriota bacterium]